MSDPKLVEQEKEKRIDWYQKWAKAFNEAHEKEVMPIFREHYEFLFEWAEMGIKHGDWAELPPNLLEREEKLKEIEELYRDE
jgi:hypothetical protein